MMKNLLLILFSSFFFKAPAQLCFSTKLTPGADTIIYFGESSACSMSVGFFLDYDEVDFCYNLKIDSASGISDGELMLLDSWGNKVFSTKEKSKQWASGYNGDPTNGEKSFYYVFSYKDKNGNEQSFHGHVKDLW